MAELDIDAKELAAKITSVEKRIDQLKTNYELYFQGIDRLQPSAEHKGVKDSVLELRRSTTRNTALRFKINQLVARMNTFETYWNRITRQIEEGTYHRDLFKARYRSGQRKNIEQNTQDQQTEGTAPSPPPPASLPGSPSGRTSPTSNINEQQVGAIYNAYISAKQRCKESTKGFTKEAVASSLRKQVPAIMKKYNCKSVEFKVVIKSGKAILKAVPKF
jgi:hypothetical protein